MICRDGCGGSSRRTTWGSPITVVFAAALAFVQWQRHGGAPYADFFRNGDINMHRDQLVVGMLFVPRIVREEWQFAPEGSLWFVLVVVQYYLLFPAALRALRAFGPAAVAAAALAVTIVSLALMIAAAGDLQEYRSWVEMGIPFRVSSLGWGSRSGWAAGGRPHVRAGDAVVTGSGRRRRCSSRAA